MPSQEEEGFEFRVVNMTVHPQFNYYTLSNDIAVWRLEPIEASHKKSAHHHLTFHQHLAAMDVNAPRLRLDNGNHSLPGHNSTVIGWGAISEGGKPSDVLMELNVPVVKQTRCNAALGPRVDRSMICAGGVEGRDACAGDSGGPLVVMRDFGRPVLIGVVSWGRGCARAGYPGVYTRVSVFRPWLRSFLSATEQAMMDLER